MAAALRIILAVGLALAVGLVGWVYFPDSGAILGIVWLVFSVLVALVGTDPFKGKETIVAAARRCLNSRLVLFVALLSVGYADYHAVRLALQKSESDTIAIYLVDAAGRSVEATSVQWLRKDEDDDPKQGVASADLWVFEHVVRDDMTNVEVGVGSESWSCELKPGPKHRPVTCRLPAQAVSGAVFHRGERIKGATVELSGASGGRETDSEGRFDFGLVALSGTDSRLLVSWRDRASGRDHVGERVLTDGQQATDLAIELTRIQCSDAPADVALPSLDSARSNWPAASVWYPEVLDEDGRARSWKAQGNGRTDLRVAFKSIQGDYLRCPVKAEGDAQLCHEPRWGWDVTKAKTDERFFITCNDHDLAEFTKGSSTDSPIVSGPKEWELREVQLDCTPESHNTTVRCQETGYQIVDRSGRSLSRGTSPGLPEFPRRSSWQTDDELFAVLESPSVKRWVKTAALYELVRRERANSPRSPAESLFAGRWRVEVCRTATTPDCCFHHLNGKVHNKACDAEGAPGPELDTYFGNCCGSRTAACSVCDPGVHGVSLAGFDLRGLNLQGANLAGMNLTSIDFSGADLSGANLQGAVLRGSTFVGTNLRGADLRYADARGVDFSPIKSPDEGVEDRQQYAALWHGVRWSNHDDCPTKWPADYDKETKGEYEGLRRYLDNYAERYRAEEEKCQSDVSPRLPWLRPLKPAD